MAAYVAGCDLGPCSFLGAGPSSRSGKAVFAYANSEAPLSRPIAAGGAGTTVAACVDSGPAIARVVSTNSNVLGAQASAVDPLPGQTVNVDLVSGAAGDSDLVLYDASNAEIARITLTVADTTELLVEHGWSGAGPTILAGHPIAMHATTRRDNETLVGVGAVKFAMAGSVHRAPEDGSALLFGDVGWFSGQAGIGSVLASCPGVGATVPITVVDASALTNLTPNRTSLQFGADQNGLVSVSALAGAEEVYGAHCTWTSTPGGLYFRDSFIEISGRDGADWRFTMPGESLDAPPTFQYMIGGPAGHYQATCAIPGGPSTTVSIDIF